MVNVNQRLTTFTSLGSLWRRRKNDRQDGKVNGATHGLGLFVTKHDETKPDVALCGYTEVPNGLLDGMANEATDMKGHDVQGLIDDNKNITYTDPAKDDEFIGCLGAGKGATINHLAMIDHDNPGFLESMDPANESIAQVPPFRIVGIFMATYSAVALKAQYCWVKGK